MDIHEDSYEYMCERCQEKDEDIKDMKYWFAGIINELYSTSRLDDEYLENALQELGSLIGMKIPKTLLQVQRYQPKVASIKDINEFWEDYSRTAEQV